MNLSKQKIAIIGGGNIGVSLACGLAKSGKINCADITITRRRQQRLETLASEGFGTTTNNKEAVASANIVVLAILPQQLNDVLDDIKSNLQPQQLLISVVSGVTINDIHQRVGANIPVVRAMPNTAIAIGESMTCFATNAGSKANAAVVKELFDTVGVTMEINEDQMTSATALCACGIAFFLRSIRAASQGGIEIDFHSDEALKMAAQTAKGAAALLLHNNSHPEDEIDRVTSPKGCTIAGLNQMEHHGFSSAFIKGITTSANKAGNLYTNNDE